MAFPVVMAGQRIVRKWIRFSRLTTRFSRGGAARDAAPAKGFVDHPALLLVPSRVV